jgi:hypothetical protein
MHALGRVVLVRTLVVADGADEEHGGLPSYRTRTLDRARYPRAAVDGIDAHHVLDISL